MLAQDIIETASGTIKIKKAYKKSTYNNNTIVFSQVDSYRPRRYSHISLLHWPTGLTNQYMFMPGVSVYFCHQLIDLSV